MNKKRNWAIAIVISAAAGIFALENVSAPAPIDAPTKTSTAKAETPSPTPTYEGCGFMWAYHDDPELSAKVNEAIQSLEPSASARAQLFGEDCVYADGHSTFSVMETDFYIQLPANDLTAEEKFGNWIGQTMEIIIALPEDKIQGRKGFAEFTFIKSETEQLIIRVSSNDYLNLAGGISGMHLFKKFYTPIPTAALPAPITPTP